MATNATKLDFDAGVVILETWQKNGGPSIPTTAWLGTTLVALLCVFFISRKASTTSSTSTIPLMNPPRFYDICGIRAKLSFVFGARELLAKGARTGGPFRLLTDLGEMIVLPARYANEIRNDPRLSFSEVIVQVYIYLSRAGKANPKTKKSCCRGVRSWADWGVGPGHL